jgi:hypothetical protein
MIGDKTVNKREIYLEPTDKRDVWKEYCFDTLNLALEEHTLTYSSFLKLWQDHFSHVKVREYKAVTSRCKTCAILSDFRQLYAKPDIRQRCSELLAYHRACYTMERQVYYAKKARVIADPARYMSITYGGMAQSHTELYGDPSDLAHPLPHHVQGILEHGQCMVGLSYAVLFQFLSDALLVCRLSTEHSTTSRWMAT